MSTGRSRSTGTRAAKGGRQPTARSGSGARRSTARASSGNRRSAARTGSGARHRTARSQQGRPALRHLLHGDRLYLLALVVVVTVVGVMAAGPLQGYTAAADRVEALEHTRDQLRSEVDALEERERRLQDPEELELLARSELGLVKPGEIPFVVVAPDDEEFAQVHPQVDETDEGGADDAPWYRRFGRALADLFATDA